MDINPVKPDRSRIDLSTEATARGWAKKLGVSTAELATAVERVGNNAATVRKELARAASKNPVGQPEGHGFDPAATLPKR